jgi:membrane protein DedA with SNARE-associated domain
MEHAERWFDRWGSWGVLLGRITPIVRSFVSIPAGIFRMPLVPYTLLTIPGSVIWCFVLAGVGWAAGTSYTHFNHAFDYLEIAVVAGAVLAAVYLVLRRRSTKLDQRA